MMTNQRGNILFLILLAIILFVALTYAVNSGMRGGGKSASAEAVQLAVGQLLQDASQMENTIGRMRLSNECKDTQISFENPSVSGYTNSNAPSDKRCHVFNPAGGGMSWRTVPQAALDTTISHALKGLYMYGGNDVIYNIPVPGNVVGDLVMFAPMVSKEVCAEINLRLFGDGFAIRRTNSLYTLQAYDYFIGNYGAGTHHSNGYTGQRAACEEFNNFNYGSVTLPQNSYVFYQVLIAR